MSVILYFRSLRELDLANTSPISLKKLFSCARQINANTFSVRRVNLWDHTFSFCLQVLIMSCLIMSTPRLLPGLHWSNKKTGEDPGGGEVPLPVRAGSSRCFLGAQQGTGSAVPLGRLWLKKSFLWLKTFCWHPIFSLFRESSCCFILVPASSIFTQRDLSPSWHLSLWCIYRH